MMSQPGLQEGRMLIRKSKRNLSFDDYRYQWRSELKKRYDIGFAQACQLSLEHVSLLPSERRSIPAACGRVAAETIHALVDSPSVRSSTKDGYAVLSGDIQAATVENPVQLTVSGHVAAGEEIRETVSSGTAIRVLSGAPVPDGADAVLADEFAGCREDVLFATADSPPGKNIIPSGFDVKAGKILVEKGEVVTPQIGSLLAAGGHDRIKVYRMPVVGLLATGSEVLLPGQAPEPGKLFASNVILQQGWLMQHHFRTILHHAGDEHDRIRAAVKQLSAETDVLITSGGAWKGDRDLMESVFESLGWRQVFHRVRMGPGKAVGMGLLHDKPVFCLPGGPTSNAMAFWMIAVPAICKMAGFRYSPFIEYKAPLEKEIRGDVDWTQFVDCRIVKTGDQVLLRPEKIKSRLMAIARTQAIVIISEGVSVIPAGTEVPCLCINDRNGIRKLQQGPG